MSKIVEVKLWGTTIGHLGYVDDTGVAAFQYNDAPFSISPLRMPNPKGVYQFRDTSERTFKGLPGVFADSLPDKFGDQLIDIYAAQKGLNPKSVTPLDRLLYIGDRSMGALTYHPGEAFETTEQSSLDVKSLSKLASWVTSRSHKASVDLMKADNTGAAIKLIRVGSSAGGARAKALVSRDETGAFFDGSKGTDPELSHWLMKFDAEGNRDLDGVDPKGLTRVEYIYMGLADKIGIDVPKVDFVEEGEDFHFMIERFDRIKKGHRIERQHYVSWAGIADAHRDVTGAYSYEQIIQVCRNLKLPQEDVKEVFRRAVFNVLARNQDDHTKNTGFIMDKQGNWRLSRGFDLTYSYDPLGRWTKTHQINLNGKRDGFTYDDFVTFGLYCDLSKQAVNNIIQSTRDHLQQFPALAKEYGVSKDLQKLVEANMRLHINVPTPKRQIVKGESIKPLSLIHI